MFIGLSIVRDKFDVVCFCIWGYRSYVGLFLDIVKFDNVLSLICIYGSKFFVDDMFSIIFF